MSLGCAPLLDLEYLTAYRLPCTVRPALLTALTLVFLVPWTTCSPDSVCVWRNLRIANGPARMVHAADAGNNLARTKLSLWCTQREEDPVTVFMGVPTMYSHLLSVYDNMSLEQQKAAQAAAKRLRLTVSGSAACPLPIMQRWHALSGEDLCSPQTL